MTDALLSQVVAALGERDERAAARMLMSALGFGELAQRAEAVLDAPDAGAAALAAIALGEMLEEDDGDEQD